MLTSLDDSDLKSFGININIRTYVENLAKIGVKAGIDGLVSSALELPNLKKKIKKDIVYVTPGIRLPEDNTDDQKRIISPGTAIKSGSSILIVGRSITQSNNPIKALNKISRNIEESIES